MPAPVDCKACYIFAWNYSLTVVRSVFGICTRSSPFLYLPLFWLTMRAVNNTTPPETWIPATYAKWKANVFEVSMASATLWLPAQVRSPRACVRTESLTHSAVHTKPYTQRRRLYAVPVIGPSFAALTRIGHVSTRVGLGSSLRGRPSQYAEQNTKLHTGPYTKP